MKKLLLILFSIPLILSRGQNLDSLYNEFVKIKGLAHEAGLPQSAQNLEPTKCSFGLISEVKLNYNRFTPKQRAIITNALDRPTTDTSFVTPSGNFRIHYNTTGSYLPQYNVDELAKAADSVYNYEIKILGYKAPPSDGTAGGDERYDIYIGNEGSIYGGTTPEFDPAQYPTGPSFIGINYDFGKGFYTKGINAAKVTVAHEFHHAIQMGNYILRMSDLFYYELTSTSMEKFVFDNINDYYQYLKDYFGNPAKSFSSIDGYDLAIWNIFLADRFDNTAVPENVRAKNIIRRTWELMPHERALPAIAQAIQEAGSSFKIEFNTFGQWTYFTNSRAVPGKYFKDALNYPEITPFIILPFTKPSSSLDVSSEAVSNNFLVFNDGSGDTKNVLVSIISNCDISGALSTIPNQTEFTYALSSQAFSGSRYILDGYYSQVKSASDFMFVESNIFNNAPISGGQIVSEEVNYVFPQPFRYSRNYILNIPATLTGANNGKGELFIYDINMKLVFSDQKSIVATDKIVIQWNGLDSNGKKLGTGVYLYVTKCGDNINKGKFVIYND
jgi:hypothetical protein